MATAALTRRLSPSDARFVVEICRTYKGSLVDEQTAARFLEDPSTYVIAAFDDEVVVGFVLGYLLDRIDGRRMMLLYELEVAEDHHRRGIGRRLVGMLRQLAEEDGADNMWVTTGADLAPANAFYERTGAEKVGPDEVIWEYRLFPKRARR